MTEREQNLGQIDRLTSSHVLHGSESLCKLLRYLARHVLDHPGTPIKEYQIATEVFGRSADFDPQLDSMVRVQAGRLRVKLSEYYASDGAEDSILVELPKGTYVVAFHHRSTMPGKGMASGNGSGAHPAAEAAPRRNWIIAIASLTFLLAVAAVVILSLVSNRNSAQAGISHDTNTQPAAMRVFWNGFVSGSDEPWVIFSNAKFVGRPDSGLRYYDAGKDQKNIVIFDQYTGVGEVLAVHALDHLFEEFHREIRVKRGSLFSLDDAKNNNLIFVGSPLENLTLLEIPGTEEFVFHRVPSGTRKGDPEIVNVHPQPGEPKELLGTPSDEQMTEDYAVVAMVKGLEPSQAVLILAGETTLGTQAAVEYVCNKNSVEQLLLRLSVAQTGQLKPFEAVIRVKVTRGVPVSTELVALRATN
ncbi:MAG TPA: hypothetical protein VGJ06_12275 [Candidatus Acidoferrum sp.]